MESYQISKKLAQDIWIRAQGLHDPEPFGRGPQAAQLAIEHLGYVQIDTINVIERCHHHILFTRVPGYRPRDLRVLQSEQKSIFEYWTHALSYVPMRDYPFYIRDMKNRKQNPGQWLSAVDPKDYRALLHRIRKDGALTIRDIEDDVLVEKNHLWASKKPSKKALQLGFYTGDLAISERSGMLKKYELASRHFGWKEKPKMATVSASAAYLLDRALRSQGLVTADSACYLNNSWKPHVRKEIKRRLQSGALIPAHVANQKVEYILTPQTLEAGLTFEANHSGAESNEMVHLLSPFDPLVIQRKRFESFFDYFHRFEAYLPKQKRVFGYFGLPVLADKKVVAVLDLKTDRQAKCLVIQNWTWLEKNRRNVYRRRIESALHNFEKFQLNQGE